MRVDSESTQQINSFEQLGRVKHPDNNSSSNRESVYLNDDAYKVELSSGAQFANTNMNEIYRQIQDSASLIQTAEEGARETESLLTRIQELVEKASCEELDDTERAGIQQNIDELVSEVDRVAQLTQEKIQEIISNSSMSASNLKLSNLSEELAAEYVALANNYALNDSAFDINCGDDSLQITLQIGANQGQTMTINIRAMNGKKLGIAGIDLTTRDGAVKAMKTLDEAIESVSSQRAGLGATVRCLEHTINYLTTMRDNLADAESRIRDVDMAKEYSEYLKNSIQSKIAGAMLVHANQRPKMILKLLEII